MNLLYPRGALTAMRSYRAIKVATLCLLAGCALASMWSCDDEAPKAVRRPGIDAGGVVPDDPDSGTLGARAEAAFRLIQPELLDTCGASCHGDTAISGNPWLKGPDPYVAVRNFPGAITLNPIESKLLTKGKHAGPKLDGPLQGLRDGMIRWLNLEAEILKSRAIPTSQPFSLVLGDNQVDIGPLSKSGGTEGTTLRFVAARTGSIVTISKLQVSAPGGTGIRLKRPVFIIVAADNKETIDPVDSLQLVDQKVPAGATVPLSTSQMFLQNWADTNRLKLGIELLEKAQVNPVDASTPDGEDPGDGSTDGGDGASDAAKGG